MRRREIVAGLCACVIVGGSALVLVSWRRGEAAERRYREALTAGFVRARSLDLVAARDRDGARASLRTLLAVAAGGPEAAALQPLAACLARPDCDPAPLVFEQKGRLGAALDRAEQAADRARQAADRTVWIAAFASLVAALGLCWLVRAGPRAETLPATATPPAPTPAATADERAALEATLRDRLEQLYEARKLARDHARFAAYGELAAGLSHGLKTPLACVRAAAQVAQAKLAADHAVQDQLDDIVEQVDALTEQVNRLLRTMGTAAPQLDRMAARDLVAPLDRRYATGDAERRVGWRLEASPDAPAISVDPELIEMALRNLIDNAFAAAPVGTEVELKALPCSAPARVGLEDEAPAAALRELLWLELAVIDHGPGIPGAMAAGELGKTSKASGSGIGLAIARRIAARHGGALLLGQVGGTTRASMILPPAGAAS